MDLSFVRREVNTTYILEKLIDGVCSTNKLIGIGLEDITEDQRRGLILTYEKLVKEEAKELKHAIETKDKVEFLDAVVDTLVVGCYYLLLKGENFDNLTYLESDQTLETYTKEFLIILEDDITELFYMASEIFFKLNIDHEKAVDIVLASNLSKFPSIFELADSYHNKWGFTQSVNIVQWQCEIIEAKGRYTGVHTQNVLDSSDTLRLVFWATHDNKEEKLKYVKPITFIEPDFASCFYY